jgi:UDP-2,3-diacylglucosamine pyrophosphatase LpxH
MRTTRNFCITRTSERKLLVCHSRAFCRDATAFRRFEAKTQGAAIKLMLVATSLESEADLVCEKSQEPSSLHASFIEWAQPRRNLVRRYVQPPLAEPLPRRKRQITATRFRSTILILSH